MKELGAGSWVSLTRHTLALWDIYLFLNELVGLVTSTETYWARGWPRTVGHNPINLNQHGGK